ncbi:MAG: isochorismatase family protein [Desulfobacteraceae bacterium]|nr:MAG: isochorismatase family protein [Desulfobacteraceae bacterium]
MFDPVQHLQKGDGLLIIDVQWDFCPGGLLPVPEGDRIIPVVNKWTEAALKNDIPVYFSRDWHPIAHISFKERGGDWPPHCIQDTDGAQFHPNLYMDRRILVITKGVRFDQDQNSVFDQTGFGHQLDHDGVKRLWVGGLAQDVCVLKSVLDARSSGLDVGVIREATRPIKEESGRRAIEEMIKAGATII